MSFGCMTTYGGRTVELNDLSPADVDIEDIIWHHVHHPRWNSATRVPVSVADHVLFCDDLRCEEISSLGIDIDDDTAIALAKDRLDLLLHDAAEAYTSDLPTGAKPDVIRQLQDRIDLVVRDAMGLTWTPDPVWIRRYDTLSMLVEARAYMHPNAYLMLRTKHHDVVMPAMGVQLWGPEAGAVEMRTRLNYCLELVHAEQEEAD